MAVGIRTEVLDAWADADSIPGLPALLMEQAYRAHLQGGITVYAGILFDGDASDPGLTALGEGFQEPTGILQPILFWQGDMVPAILADTSAGDASPIPPFVMMGVGLETLCIAFLIECGYGCLWRLLKVQSGGMAAPYRIGDGQGSDLLIIRERAGAF